MTGTKFDREQMARRHKARGIVLHFIRLRCMSCGWWILLERYGTRRGGKKGDESKCPKCGVNAWKLLRGRDLSPVEAVTAALADIGEVQVMPRAAKSSRTVRSKP